jgi:hypothetical protein
MQFYSKNRKHNSKKRVRDPQCSVISSDPDLSGERNILRNNPANP